MLAKFVQQAIHLNCGFEDLGQDLVSVVDVMFLSIYIYKIQNIPFGLDKVKSRNDVYQSGSKW